MVVRWKKREEHSKLEEQPVQKPWGCNELAMFKP